MKTTGNIADVTSRQSSVEAASQNQYWVTVFCNTSTDTYSVHYSIDIHKLLSRLAAATILVYVKCYNDMCDALGHKLFLDTISADTLKRIIRLQNPKRADMRENFEQYVK